MLLMCGRFVYLVLELVEGGELFDKIVKDGAFSEKDAAKLIRKITEALQYLHEKKVCHRDLKPENLLLTSRGNDADVKIADFGVQICVCMCVCARVRVCVCVCVYTYIIYIL